ncbi:MAG TPA: hypothetical protein VL334_22805 [Anaerolineae bacterium]|nr:hypothetical protein [Anaerolineae bacterium]
MAQVIAVNAVHAGSGVSSIVANVAALLAAAQPALRVGVIDACLSAPTLHLLYGLPRSDFGWTLNDHLAGRCSLEAAVHRMPVGDNTAQPPTLLLIPADPDVTAVAKAGHLAYDVENLGTSCQQLASNLALDVLFIDTEAGLPPSTLAVLAAASAVLLVLALDKQHYQGTARTVAVVDQLPVARRRIMVNLVSPSLRYDNVQAQVMQSFGWDVTAMVPYCDELMALGSASLFALRYPTHPVTAILEQMTQGLVGEGKGLEIPG